MVTKAPQFCSLLARSCESNSGMSSARATSLLQQVHHGVGKDRWCNSQT